MPVSLEILDLYEGGKFTGGIPAEWGSMTNLKRLSLYSCGLDGECLVYVQCDTKRSQLRSESCAGPPLPETLRLLAPLASNLESLNLSLNKLGGTITDDIAAFTKLAELGLYDMGLEGECARVSVEPGKHTNRNPFKKRITHCAGPIPVELLRWKFVEKRTVELKGNAGLELPADIGELGDSVTQIDLSEHGLRGV